MSISIKAKEFVVLESISQVQVLIEKYDFSKKKYFILGHGCNTIFSGDFDGLVLKNEIDGVEIMKEDSANIQLKVGSGFDWDTFVNWTTDREYSGIENLAYIPGSVGAAPVGNIAAYGQQTSDVIVSVEAIDLFTGEIVSFQNSDCNFRYRHSIFKESSHNRYYITHVVFQLSKYSKFDTNYHSRYANESLSTWLEKEASPPYKPKDIAKAVTSLRKYKLPMISEYGTIGSAFVNPFVTKDRYKELAKLVPELQCYPVDKMDYTIHDWENVDEMSIVKIPAGRLLDELGWKDKWIGNVGTFERHALCVITNKNASAQEVLDYLEKMKKDVKNRYNIDLVSEVIIV